MKRKQILIPLITIFIIFLTACKKDTITEPAPTPNVILSGDSNYLSKIIYIEKTNFSIDTLVREFNFDNQRRVTTIQDYSLNPTTYEKLIQFSYNNNDSLPFKRINISIASGQRDSSISYLFYNLNGLLIKDSVVEFKHISPYNNQPSYTIIYGIKNYTYSSNKVFVNSVFSIIYDLIGLYNPYTQNDTSTFDANKNVIERKSKKVNSGTSTFITEFNGSYIYDAKPSNCKALNINNIFTPDFVSSGLIYNQIGSKNTMIKSTEIYNYNGNSTLPIIHDYTDKYIFKLNGFPALALVTYPPSDEYTKYIFIYTTL